MENIYSYPWTPNVETDGDNDDDDNVNNDDDDNNDANMCFVPRS